VHLSYRAREALIGESAQQTWRRCSTCSGSESLDEKNLKETRQDDITRGPQLTRFLYYKLHDGSQPPLAANVHELRKERNQQRCVRRTKHAVTNQQSNVRRPALNAMSHFAG
jgi:hypothetical protein